MTFDNRYSAFWKQRVESENRASMQYNQAATERRLREIEHAQRDKTEEIERFAASAGLKMEDLSSSFKGSVDQMRLPPIKTSDENYAALRSKQRTNYLKEQKTHSPLERFGQPVTSSQAVGWEAQWSESTYSPHVKRAIVRQEFYRNGGIPK